MSNEISLEIVKISESLTTGNTPLLADSVSTYKKYWTPKKAGKRTEHVNDWDLNWI